MGFPKNRQQLRSMIALAKLARGVSTVLRIFGVTIPRDTLDNAIRIGEEVLEVADRFNATFAERGWIACGALNNDAARAALDEADSGHWREADEVLAASWAPGIIRIELNKMRRLKCFESRAQLAVLALEDYEAGRYHACVPVVLALLDGAAKDLTGAGPFRMSLQTTSKESFLEIGPGFAALMKTMSAPRRSTRADRTDVPYRHGIMHGTDLGYANKIVAAKAWAALVAFGQYAQEHLAPTELPPSTLLEVLRKSAATRQELDAMESSLKNWAPRSESELARIVSAGQFEPGTPEAVADAILRAWSKGQYLLIAQMSSDSLKENPNGLAGKLKKNIGIAPRGLKITAIEDSGPSAAWVSLVAGDAETSSEVRLRLLHMKGAEWIPRTIVGGQWIIHSLWPLEFLASDVTRRRGAGEGA
ncbi:hypothetical protein WMF04_33120 [Sorangium sp. So ce260]|uniref:hypothetical protein n=1 Tax=Sorangium sp. So ce260 TaxID=3133291 RepID=UPI003F6265E4